MTRPLDKLWESWLFGPDRYWGETDRQYRMRCQRHAHLWPALWIVALVVILACFTVPS